MPWSQDAPTSVIPAEHLIGGCAETAEAIVRRCPRVDSLATSREPLGIGGQVYLPGAVAVAART